MSTSTKLNKYALSKDVEKTLYHSMIGIVLYLTSGRPDIAFTIGFCARYQASQKESHLHALKCIIKYVSGALSYNLWYSFDTDDQLYVCSDVNWVGDVDGCRITSAGCFYFGSALVFWLSKKQNSISLATTEAEYIIVDSCCTKLLWMKQILWDYAISQGTMTISYDNTSAIYISRNPVQHLLTKHIKICEHFIRDLVEEKVVSLNFVSTDR